MSRSAPPNPPLRVFDLIRYQQESFPKPDALASKINGVWKKYSTQELVQIVDELAWGLHLAGLRQGDRVANITETNRPEWNFIDLAVMSVGAIHVPIYPNIAAEEISFILKDCEPKMIFVSSARLEKLIGAVAALLPEPLAIYSYEETHLSWQTLRRNGSATLNSAAREQLGALRTAVRPEDVATLIYTSGTTGTPKGVMLSHENLMTNCAASCEIIQSGPEERALSFLPLCHIYERTIVNIYLRSGTSIYYAENLNTIGENLREIRPHVFTTVPRLLEKIYERIVDRGEQLKGWRRSVFFWALRLAADFDPDRVSPQKRIQLAIADRLVFGQWRKALGGRIRAIVSGSAALRPRLARVFWAARMQVYEGYGPTEASPVISVNQPFAGCHRIGTVGPVIPGGEVKLAEDGEILYRGPNVMLGYYHRPDLTAEAIDAQGWLHTGDIGEFEGKFLRITDRKKEIFKTSGGKYIAPQQIENKLKESEFVSQAMVVGENHKFPTALIVPSLERVNEYFRSRGISFASVEELVANSEVRALFAAEVNRLNGDLGRFAQVKKFALLPQEWTIDSGELTPTLKLKRKVLLDKFSQQIAQLYAGEERAAEVLSELRVPGDESRVA